MPNIFFCTVDNENAFFDSHETTHFKVVRKKAGDIVICTDGNGNKYKVQIKQLGKKESFGSILESKYIGEEKNNSRLILFAPSGKWERLRWLIEKAVELGVDKIYITKTKFSNRDYSQKQDKINFLIRDSCKQCARFHFPKFEIINFNDITEVAPANTFFLDFNGKKIPEEIGNNVGLIVGPEGGFSEEEIKILKQNFVGIVLGRKILRFETAALVSLSYFSLKLSKI
ncbi:16S rRNA (uracil(1498)-N(3))-methyltransferase [Thermosipho atlanticus]|uniref:Ribosomal RNA small subunit methyltransferase E n=1 Tax=Thermosipho atlanticus DSM 15807 TaxID=1123380 RepID=A0A1M5RUC4_9BACT|nr:16S rRNA (uracil(1498)-N(3))-methyltransferase [Thermosipho atlanticus]SHH29907.1 16S rRNA (uracil1498-N3)-methyltransferase [Thermosipho atlanticus DSM 15807]